ncbi:MAG TPA: RNA polymerase sigma factor [Thermoanaerobaculia bacterium]|jgi:RNA polymerase sigma-70 factor (ECF subfamily)
MSRDELYCQIAREFGPPLERLARAYEADPGLRADLLQEIQLGLWRSVSTFRNQCSLRTWVYRVAHNIALSHVARRQRQNPSAMLRLDDVEPLPATLDVAAEYVREELLTRLRRLMERLPPLDRQVLSLYLEGMTAEEISEISGISPANVATRIHRAKKFLAGAVRKEGEHARR